MDIFSSEPAKKQSPIEILTGALAEMTQRAMDTEHELAVTKNSENTWYQLYQSQKEEIEDLRNELDKVKKENETLQSKLDELKEENAALQAGWDNAEEVCSNLRDKFHAEKGAHKAAKEKLERVYATIGKAGGVLNNESE